MDEDFLSYYHQELAFIRQQGKEFAKAYPKVAGRLKLGQGVVEDPHVSRLIESFAFLTARIQQRLEDDLPEINNTLLDIIYPHYQLPIPSMSVVEFESQSDLQEPYFIPIHTLLESEPLQGNVCTFRTSYPVSILPIKLAKAQLYSQPLPGPRSLLTQQAVSCLKLTLCALNPAFKFQQLSVERLRFYLNLEPPYVFNLYELLLNHSTTVALVNENEEKPLAILPAESLSPVGFDEKEALLPFPARSFTGYRILSEFFTFPEKFLFIDLNINETSWKKLTDNQFEIYIYFSKQVDHVLERHINSQTFKLNCTPIINLFPHTAEPLRVDYTQPAYPIIMDTRSSNLYHLHSILNVTAINDQNKLKFYRPFYEMKYSNDTQAPYYWHLSRRPKFVNSKQEEYEISFTDDELTPLTDQAGELIINIEALATNNHLPTLLPFGDGKSKLQFIKGMAAIKNIRSLRAYTAPLWPSLRQNKRWQLISHLALNHSFITDNEQGITALKTILQLYDHKNTEDTQSLIAGIIDLSSKRIAVRSRMGLHDALYQGIELTVTVDETCYVGSSLFLFGLVLERFLNMYCAINSFVELVIKSKQRRGELYRWKPRAGCKVLL